MSKMSLLSVAGTALLACATMVVAGDAEARRGGSHGGGSPGGARSFHASAFRAPAVRAPRVQVQHQYVQRQHVQRRHARASISGSSVVYGTYDYGYFAGDDDCRWLLRRARDTGKRYWWRRYYECIE